MRGALQSSVGAPMGAANVVGVIAVASLIGNVLQYSRYSPWRPLVTVGHRVVRQREYLALLDTTAGKAVLNKIVYEQLIQDAATQAGVMPTSQDVDMRLTDLRRRTPNGLPQDDQFWNQLRMQMALENLRMRGTTASDAEIAAFYDQHKAEFATPARAQTTLVATTNAADAARAEQMLAAGKPESQIAALPGMHVAGIGGFSVNIDSLPPAVRQEVGQTVMALPIGAVKTLRVAANVYFTLKPQQREEGEVAPLRAGARGGRARSSAGEGTQRPGGDGRPLPGQPAVLRHGEVWADISAMCPQPPAAPAPTGPKTASLPSADTQ